MSNPIIERIRADLTNLRKEGKHGPVSFMTFILAEVQNVGKNKGNRETSVPEAVAAIKAILVNETDESNQMYMNHIIHVYSPKALAEDEIDKIATERVGQGDNMGMVMAYFKKNYDGRYDGKALSDLVRRKLA